MRQINVVLASASPRRKELLNQIGINPEIWPSDIDEIVSSDIPEQVVMELSCQKAEHVWKTVRNMGNEDMAVIGADTVVACGGSIMGKPADEEEAVQMISRLRGGSHQVYTGVTIITLRGRITFAEKTDVFVSHMTEEEIREYVARGESMDKAGAYGIQGYFAAYIERIEGSYTNVMGLPAGQVYQQLKQLMEE